MDLTCYSILGIPWLIVLGIIVLIFFLCTAYLGMTIHKGQTKIPFKWHVYMARISITLATIYAILIILAYY